MFLDRPFARSVAEFLRRAVPVQAIIVPSAAFLDDLDRWVLVVFLEKLPADPRTYITSVTAAGTFHVEFASPYP